MKDSMTLIKAETLTNSNITDSNDGYYRYVNHDRKIATTGFQQANKLTANKDVIRFDEGTLKRMKVRYSQLYPDRL